MTSHTRDKAKASEAPELQLLNLVFGQWAAQVVYVIAKLKIADTLGSNTHTLSTLASQLGMHRAALFRFLTAAEALDLVRISKGDELRLTETGNLLRSNDAYSLQPFVLLCNQDWHVKTWEHLSQRLKVDGPIFDKLMDQPFFEFLQSTPDARVVFDKAMDSLSEVWGKKIVQHIDFTQTTSVMDIGGGSGKFLAEILRQNSTLKGFLFDLPEAIKSFKPTLPHNGNSPGRDYKLIKGSFFDPLPAIANCHVMKLILHDWKDEDAQIILNNSRKALDKGGRLVIVEQILDKKNNQKLASLSDMEMLLFGTGQERSLEQLTRLMDRAGFSVDKVTDSGTPFSIIQAVAG